MADINSSSTFVYHCNDDPSIEAYIYNLTSSYADTSNESSVVATSIIMFVLAAVFFNVSLFSRVSEVSSVLNPTVRLVLSTSLSLFLPVMSYLFSEAKNAPMLGVGAGRPTVRGRSSDLPLRARMILTWMLLVELLRKKVEGILVNAGVRGTSTIIGHVTSVLWLGNLVFFNLKGAGRKVLFGILWVLCAAKLMQRVAISEIGKLSLAHGKNARLLSSYMAQMLRAGREEDVHRQQPADADDGSARLTACKYVVMGEEKMVQEGSPHGYKLDLEKITSEDGGVVTVGKIWRQLDRDKQLAANNRPHFINSVLRLKRLSLSFALFKLFRRRFEQLPAMTKEETDDCRDLIFRGLCKEEEDPETALFQVISNEVNFLSEYYHSVLPVMFASPYFFVINYLVLPIVVLALCAMTAVLCADGNVSLLSLQSIRQDNYALSFGIIPLTKCLWENVLEFPQALFSAIDISICYLLFLAVIYEEVREFIIFVLSNWFSVSLLCNYTAKSSWTRRSPAIISRVLSSISWVRNKLSYTRLIMCKQFSVPGFCWLSMTLPAVPLPRQAKRSIMQRLMAYGDDGGANPLSNGRSALSGQPSLSRFCESDSVAEVIATWHIATSLLESKCQQAAALQKRGAPRRPRQHGHGHRKVATILSMYCAYLLAFHPELLPADQEGTKHVYKGMKKDLKKALGCWGYYLLSRNGRYNKLIENADSLTNKGKADDMTVVDKGVVLGKELVELMVVKGGEDPVWEILAQLWVELIVYLGPSGREEQDKAHQVMLVQGELVTMLWALTMHTGITRRLPVNIVPVDNNDNIEEGIHPSSL